MASFLRKLLGKEECSIMVAQYKRSNYSVGDEEHFHWAIVVMTGENGLEGRVYQAVNRINDTRDGVAWDISTAKAVSLEKSIKCLGGVRIGIITKKNLKELDKALLANTPEARSPEWNCRDWVMECIAIMQAEGWVYNNIRRQEDLLPAMKQASILTMEKGLPVVVELSDD
ncbi:hypothetical protein BD414DRAFT_460186 [Trametes punicea]|nr:hypothetical protein BD414DRAFT_460186 [Trametes punicea]